MALTRSPLGALARADVASAVAGIAVARQYENPTLSASYSRSAPQAHISLDVPFDWRQRQPRIAAANLAQSAAETRLKYGQAALKLDVDTAYTRAQAFAAKSQLSARTASDADSLRTIARLRRDAGDASDLDVELANVFAGQSANVAISDSLSAISSRAALQALIGLAPDSVEVTLTELMDLSNNNVTVTLTGALRGNERVNAANGGTATVASFPVAAALQEAEAASNRVLVEQRRRLQLPSLSVGFETVDPGAHGVLPTIGFALPLPLFNRNSAGIQLAQAELARARATVLLARVQQATALASAQRDVNASRARLARSNQLVASANRIASLSLIAYREGATPLTTALDAQRSAREALSQYVDDVAAARIADSLLRLFSLTSADSP